MNLGEIFKMAAEKDLAALQKKNDLVYSEFVKDGNFWIRLTSRFEEAYLECHIPDNGIEDEYNYLRTYFLSMVFNSAIYGMKRLKNRKDKKLK